MDQLTEEQLLAQIITYVDSDQREPLQEIVIELQPYDLAVIYLDLEHKYRLKFLKFLTDEQVAALVQELEHEDQVDILQKIGIETSANVMDMMEMDDLADIMNELPSEKIDELLGVMNQETSESIQELLQYAPKTAGGMMTNQYVWVKKHFTVREAVEKLKEFASLTKNVYYLYALDDDKRLVGVVSYRNLLIADADELIEELMFTRVISVPVDMDQEEVARTIERYDFIAVPVVDADQRMVGIVTVDDVIDVMIEEADEDIGKFAASGKSIDFTTTAPVAAMRRLPWLILLLFLGLVSGSILSIFENTLQQVVALAFFMPMIAGMTGNTGTQSLAVIIRGLVSNELNRGVVVRLITREFSVGLIIGTTCGILVSIVTYFWQDHNLALAFVIGCSLFLTLIIGTLAGTVIPLILYRFKVDPAVASGPLITTLNDIFSLVVYFGTASAFISQLV